MEHSSVSHVSNAQAAAIKLDARVNSKTPLLMCTGPISTTTEQLNAVKDNSFRHGCWDVVCAEVNKPFKLGRELLIAGRLKPFSSRMTETGDCNLE